MSAVDDLLFETMLRIENKDIFVDLKKNRSGVYLKISERNGNARNTVLIPASGILRLRRVLDEVAAASVKTKSVSHERRNRVNANPEITLRSVYVTGLTWDTEEGELAEYFSQAGTVLSASILRQRRNGMLKASMGCGVVEFADRAMALAAVEMLNETELNGRSIRCREDRNPDADGGDDDDEVGGEVVPARPATTPTRTRGPPRGAKVEGGPKVTEPTKVFVTSLTWDTTEDDLEGYFSTVGAVVGTEILASRKGRSMGSGVVEFADAASVPLAIAKLSNTDLKGRVIVVREYFQ